MKCFSCHREEAFIIMCGNHDVSIALETATFYKGSLAMAIRNNCYPYKKPKSLINAYYTFRYSEISPTSNTTSAIYQYVFT